MYVPVCSCVCVALLSPLTPPITWGAEQQKPPHPHMTPHPRSRIRARKQLPDRPWEELPLKKRLNDPKVRTSMAAGGFQKNFGQKNLGLIFFAAQCEITPKWHIKLRCNCRKVALQKLHCNICFSAVQTSFLPKAALQQARKTALRH